MASGNTLHNVITDSLTDECSISFTADDVYKAIANGLVTYDLWNEPLAAFEQSKVYRDKATLEFARRLEVPMTIQEFERGAGRVASIQSGASISYDGRSYTVTLVGANHATLFNNEGSTELPISTYQRYTRSIKKDKSQSNNPRTRHLLARRARHSVRCHQASWREQSSAVAHWIYRGITLQLLAYLHVRCGDGEVLCAPPGWIRYRAILHLSEIYAKARQQE